MESYWEKYKKLIEKYGQDLIDFTIEVDNLTPLEIKDVEYLEDRILHHTETYNNKVISKGEVSVLLLSLETLREQLESDEGMEDKISRVNKLIIKLETSGVLYTTQNK